MKSPRTPSNLQSPIIDHPFNDLPTHIIIYSDDGLESSLSNEDDSDSITNDSFLNEFIQDPDFGQVPLLERTPSYQHYFDFHIKYHTNNENRLDIQSIVTKNYYLVEWLSSILISIVMSSSLFTSVIINNGQITTTLPNGVNLSSNGSESLLRYIFIRIVNFSIVAFISYIFTTADTYKAINTSSDFLPVNWILYNYSFGKVLTYLCIHVTAGTIGGMITIGFYYSMLEDINKQQVFDGVLSSSRFYLVTPSYFLLSAFTHLITVIGLTFIMEDTNTLNCKQKVLQRTAYVFSISMIFGIAIGPIGFLLYRLCLFMCLYIVYGINNSANINIGNGHMLLAIVGHVVTKILFYPFVSFHIKYIWRNAIRRYLEY